jgi:hypothetical protein
MITISCTGAGELAQMEQLTETPDIAKLKSSN